MDMTDLWRPFPSWFVDFLRRMEMGRLDGWLSLSLPKVGYASKRHDWRDGELEIETRSGGNRLRRCWLHVKIGNRWEYIGVFRTR